MNNFNYIKLNKNTKLPINKWSDSKNHTKELPDVIKYNAGIPTGEINDIVVVDVDVKDNGLNEWEKIY